MKTNNMEEAPSEKQIKYAIDIARDLELVLPDTIYASKNACKQFLSAHISLHKAHLATKSDIKQASSRSVPTGSAEVRDTSNHAYKQILNYWLDAIKRASFEGLTSLPSELENCLSFPCDQVEYCLNSYRCKEVTNIHNGETVRHLVLRLSPKKAGSERNQCFVIAVFPLKMIPIKETDKKNPLPYQWGRYQNELPLFNHRLMGEYAEIEGLNLYDVDRLNHLLEDAIESTRVFPEEADLKSCLGLLDQCFDALTGKSGGLKAFVARFEKSKQALPKLKNKILDFVLVDGGAVGGAARQIKICYEEICQTIDRGVRFKLLFQLMMAFRDKKELPTRELNHETVVMSWARADNYLGHMDNAGSDGRRLCYSLDHSQRMALTVLKEVENGNLLAVNGPPGTGKTSLLRAVIADLWIEPLLTEIHFPDCPVILASAATNQAVTNIISSFDQVPGASLFDEEGRRREAIPIRVENRWIPGLKSYGWFVPASLNSKTEAMQSNYQVLQRNKGNSFWNFHYAAEQFGSLSIAMIEKSYLEMAGGFFNDMDLSVNQVIKKLRTQVKMHSNKMHQIGRELTDWMNRLTELQAQPWNHQHEILYQNLSLICLKWDGETGEKKTAEINLQNIQHQITVLNKSLKALNVAQARGFLYQLKRWALSFFSSENKEVINWTEWGERLMEYGVLLSISESPSFSNWSMAILDRIKILQSDYAAMQFEYQRREMEYEPYYHQLLALKNSKQKHLHLLRQSEQAQYCLSETLAALACPLSDRIKKGIESISSLKNNLDELFFMPIMIDLQSWLDQAIRPKLFHLAARYWEGRYILYKKKQQQLEKISDITISTEARFQELAMLAPVFVVTTHSAPKLMMRNKAERETHAASYLFDFADLLIVDEAGQATPEIGACAFAFAKRAIVVGDIKQLAPVWNIESPVDRVMIREYELNKVLQKDDPVSISVLSEYGLLVSNGCIMKMAQNATSFYDPDFETPGVMLTHHYRCRRPIIEICNQMVYDGVLKVVASATEPRQEWRNPLGFLVTSGESTKQSSGSRCNLKEAELIAKWIKEQRESIIHHYHQNNKGKALDLPDLLAVLTPYRGQVPFLKKAIAKALDEDLSDKNALANRMVIGTVHSLQGAEKNIVIFSMVDTVDPDSHHFYDKDASLMNVAVSRAKELFIVAMDEKAVKYASTITQLQLKKPSDYVWYYAVLSGKRLNPCRLILIESPNKARHIESALMQGMELEIIATNGHLTQLDTKNFSWDPLSAQLPRWQNLSEKELQVYSRVADLWNDIEALYIATDSDAEGECIAWHFINRVKEHLPPQSKQKKQLKIKRMRFNSLVKEEICYAFQNAVDGLDAGLIKSAMVRSFLDQMIVRHYPHKLNVGEFNKLCRGVGRVQLSILDIVKQFSTRQKQYAIQIEMTIQGHPAPIIFYAANKQQPLPLLFPDEKSAHAVLNTIKEMVTHEMAVRTLWKAKVKQLPEYPVINTATFLALASRVYNMSPGNVMESLQALYEGRTQLSETMTVDEEGS